MLVGPGRSQGNGALLGVTPAMKNIAISQAVERGEASDLRVSQIHQTWQQCCQSFCRYFTVRTGGDTHLVDDLMQQLWLRSRLKAGDLRNTEAEPWLWRIAQNLLREHRRRRNGRLEQRVVCDPALGHALAVQFDTEDMPAEALARREVRDQVLLALTSLRSEEQELLVMHYFEERSQVELAEALAISRRAVEGRLYRARQSLRDKLKHLDIEE